MPIETETTTMNKLSVALIAFLVVGNIVSVTLLVLRDPGEPLGSIDRVDDESLVAAIQSLDAKLDRLEAAFEAESSLANRHLPVSGEGAQPIVSAAAPDLTPVLDRLALIEQTLAEMKDVNDELAAAELREKRQAQFRAEDGFSVADELLSQKKFAVAANGYLEFLNAHPDHPDAPDLTDKAAEAFRRAGYEEKAIWLKEQMLDQFPDRRGDTLHSLAVMKKQLHRYDEAIAHATEAAELAKNDESRLWRLLYRAYLFGQRDGDEAALPVYREIERAARSAGSGGPANQAREKIAAIERRLAAAQ